MQHFRVLEFWRLFAAMGVMAFHFLRYAPAEHRWVEEVVYRLLPVMDMFFMVSGFLIMLHHGDTVLSSAGSYRRFVVRRLARIYPLYFATLLFFIVVGIAVQSGLVYSGWVGRFDFSVLPHNIFLIQGWGLVDQLTFNYVAWTLSAEWFCYLVFPLVVLVFKAWGIGGLAAMAVATMALLQGAGSAGLIPEGHWLKTYSWAAFRAFADFTIGAMISVLVRNSNWQLRAFSPAWLTFSAALGTMLLELNGYISLALLAAAVFLAALAERNNPAGADMMKPFHTVGQVSFGIYLIHPVVEVFFYSVLWRMALEASGLIPFFIFWFAPMIATVALALASSRWFERPVGRAITEWHEGVLARRYPGLTPAE